MSSDCQTVSGANSLRNDLAHDDDGEGGPDHSNDSGSQSVQQNCQSIVYLKINGKEIQYFCCKTLYLAIGNMFDIIFKSTTHLEDADIL